MRSLAVHLIKKLKINYLKIVKKEIKFEGLYQENVNSLWRVIRTFDNTTVASEAMPKEE
jgi:hypothetical protein